MQQAPTTTTRSMEADKTNTSYECWKRAVRAGLRRAAINTHGIDDNEYWQLYDWGYTVFSATDQMASDLAAR